MEIGIIPKFEEQGWVDRTRFPIDLDNHSNFFPLLPIQEIMPQILPLYNAIFKITRYGVEHTNIKKSYGRIKIFQISKTTQ
ncbi:MAG: hypothetical protein LBB73_04025 [Dysgonamonadaceae bacterium]|jgi:hypothetical protein|nr:hypothetical protein [Dysgonamonadaceae bacterium]